MLLGFLLKGLAVGIVIAVPAGPVGILCIRRTIFNGRLAGLLSGFGAATADAVFGMIAGFGLTVVSDWLLGWQHWLQFFGAAFLLVVGTTSFFSEPPAVPPPRGVETLFRDYASTFALTITNPVTILAFIAIFAALGLTGATATIGAAATLVFGVWIGSLLWWIALSFGAGLCRNVLDRRHLTWINRGSGAILVFSGLALVATLMVGH